MSNKPVRRRLGRFAIAALIYAAGVIAFTSWSYFAHRETLLNHFDQSLENATYATREIVGDDYAESLMLMGNTNMVAYKTCQKQLARFAKNGGFSAIGAAGRTGGKTVSLVAGTGGDGSIQQDDIKLGDPLPETMGNIVLDMASVSTHAGVAMVTTDHPQYGVLRIAAFYKGKTDGTGLAYIVAQEMSSLKALLREQAIRKFGSGMLLLILAIPMVVLNNRSQQRAAEELAALNTRLKEDVEGQKGREEELKDAIHDLERFNAVTAGRESRIIELKGEVNGLLEQMNRHKRYNIDKAD